MHPQMIQKLLIESSFSENDISKKIIVPCLQKMSMIKNYAFHEIKFTGGTTEFGNDIEYYEIIGPDKHRIYTGIQVKKGNIALSESVDLITQGKLAFSKKIDDLSTGHEYRFGRWIVLATGEITPQAKTHIKNEIKENGNAKNISFWSGIVISEFILDYFYDDFIQTMDIDKKYLDSQNVMMHVYDPSQEIVLFDGNLNRGESQVISLNNTVPPANVNAVFLAFYTESNLKQQGISIKTDIDETIISSLMSQVSLIPIKISGGDGLCEIMLTQFSEKIKVVIRGFRFYR